MVFEIVREITNIKTIASGRGVKIRRYLETTYGKATWRKRKGIALVKYPDGTIFKAEIHWYEASGIGRRLYKIKRIIS